MRFRSFQGALVMLSALAVQAATSSAQGPAPPTAFDGKYVGTATVTGGKYPLTCVTVSSIDMTITGGQVVVHEIRPTGAPLTFQGSVNVAGEVSASRLPHGTLSGTIHDKVFTGQRSAANYCYYSVQMVKG
jgi:hypothetical protein